MTVRPASGRRGLAVLAALAAAALPAGRVAAQASPAETPAEALLARAVAYHDPGGRWGRDGFRLNLVETRPSGPDRESLVTFEPAARRFSFRSATDGRVAAGTLDGESCTVTLDGSVSFTEAERDAFRLTCDRVVFRRDYYDYLWGLPMKLRDPGTVLDPEVVAATFDGRSALGVRITYEEGVGRDTWYVYFDPESAAMIGYRFYHDEAAGDGEYILLEGELEAAGLRLPRARTWYTHQGDRLLGTDTLVALEVLD